VKAWLKFSWLLLSWFYNALWLPEVTSCPGRINSRSTGGVIPPGRVKRRNRSTRVGTPGGGFATGF